MSNKDEAAKMVYIDEGNGVRAIPLGLKSGINAVVSCIVRHLESLPPTVHRCWSTCVPCYKS